jgi:hypothetical protein
MCGPLTTQENGILWRSPAVTNSAAAASSAAAFGSGLLAWW